MRFQKKFQIVLLLTLGLLVLMTGQAYASGSFNPNEIMLPQDMKVTLQLDCDSGSCPNSFTRTVQFERHEYSDQGANNYFSKYVNIPVTFIKTAGTTLYHSLSPLPGAVLNSLKNLGKLHGRAYWDSVSFVNSSDNNKLGIKWLDAQIKYHNNKFDGNGQGYDLKDVEYFYLTVAGLPAGKTRILDGFCDQTSCESKKLSLYTWKARACQACRTLKSMMDTEENTYPFCSMETAANTTYYRGTRTTYLDRCINTINNSHDKWAKEFMFDLGEAGSNMFEKSGGSEMNNPKYGNDGSLCTESTTWYFTRYASYCNDSNDEQFYNYTLNAQSYWKQMFDVFADSTYCYHPGQKLWRLISIDTDNYGASIWRSGTTVPQSGDVFIQTWLDGDQNGHTAMILGSDTPNASHGNKVYSIDGPTVLMHGMDMDAVGAALPGNTSPAHRLYCIGRIPDND